MGRTDNSNSFSSDRDEKHFSPKPGVHEGEAPMNCKTMDLRNKLPGEGQAWEDVSLTHIRITLAKKSQLKLPCFHFVLIMHRLQ